MNDIVYILKNDIESDEIRYSVRSVERNFPHRKVWFYGGKPDGIEPDEMVHVDQQGATKWQRVSWTLRLVCENDAITEDFWLFNDDFFVMDKVEEWPQAVRGTLHRRIESLKNEYGRLSKYGKELKRTEQALIDAGLKDNAVYRRSERPCVLDKYDCFYLTALAFIELKDGSKKKASDCLKKAKKTAERFDKAPDYDVRNIRFIDMNESLKLHDTLGKTCMDTIDNCIKALKSPELEKLWKALK